MAEYGCVCPVPTDDGSQDTNIEKDLYLDMFANNNEYHMIRPRTVYEVYDNQFNIIKVLNSDGSNAHDMLTYDHAARCIVNVTQPTHFTLLNFKMITLWYIMLYYIVYAIYRKCRY